MKPSYVRYSLLKSIDFMAQNLDQFVKRPGADFVRNRKCPFSTLLLFLLQMEAHSLDKEIRNYFPKPASRITKSGLIQQRQKLNDSALPFLFSELNRRIPLKRKYKNHFVFGVDGSATNIPFLGSDSSTQIPSNTPNVNYAQNHINVVFDVMNCRFLDVLIQPGSEKNEREAFLTFLSRFSEPENSIFVADRGYASINVLAHLSQSGHSFLFRMKTPDTKPNFLSRFTLPDDTEFDIPLEFTITRSQKKVYKEDPSHYVCLRCDRRFDFIEPGDTKSLLRLAFRLVKIQLSEDNSEYLITNLSPEEFSRADLKELYRLRWGVETAFRSLKYHAALTSFHSVRRDFIMQEIYARIILYNFTTMIMNCIPVTQKEGKVKKVSFSNAVDICRDFISHRIINEEIKEILCRYLTEVRPGRTFERKIRSKRVVPMTYRP